MSPRPPPITFTHHPSIPYTSPPTRLQTLDLWLPSSPPDPSSSTIWLIYIHGGAWRDPTQTSLCIQPTLEYLLHHNNPATNPATTPALPTTTTATPTTQNIAGIASLNYRLSPYASHPTDPSDPADSSRNVRHPAHVRDVARGIQYVREHYGVTSGSDAENEREGKQKKKTLRWAGIGHSCGATLLLQLVAGIGLQGDDGDGDGDSDGDMPIEDEPEALVLLEGIYDIPRMLRNHDPPSCPPEIAKIYREFVRGAFGEDGEKEDGGGVGAYFHVSPVAGRYRAKAGEGSAGMGLRRVVLGYSAQDELIEGEQWERMAERFRQDGWLARRDGELSGGTDGDDDDDGKRLVEMRDMKGGHDEIWEDGAQIAGLIEEVVRRLCRG